MADGWSVLGVVLFWMAMFCNGIVCHPVAPADGGRQLFLKMLFCCVLLLPCVGPGWCRSLVAGNPLIFCCVVGGERKTHHNAIILVVLVGLALLVVSFIFSSLLIVIYSNFEDYI